MQKITDARLTLVSHKLCPYVQRAVIALEELGLEYRRIDVDLGDPPDWFRRLSPLGKVPLLLIDDETVLFESAVIADYVNEIGGGSLLRGEPLARAEQRAWIEFASATLNTIGALYNARGQQNFRRVAAELDSKWRQLESYLTCAPYFSGSDFSLVDAAFGPVFRYFDVFGQLVDDDFLGDYPKIGAWRTALAARHSVRKAVSPDYPALLTKFLAARDSRLGKAARDCLERAAA